MQLDKGKITGAQFLFAVICFIQSSFLLISHFVVLVQQDAWLTVLLGFLFTMPQMLVFLGLMKSFPGKNLIEINDLVLGKWVGKIFSGLYIFFFITLMSLNLRDMGDFVQKTIMPRTPEYVTIILFILVCAWSARNGVEVVARYSVLFTLISFVVLLIATALNVNIMSWENFLPILRQPLKSYVQGAHIVSTIPLGELIIFLMIAPNVQSPPKKVRKYLFLGLVLGVSNLLLIILQDTAILGNAIVLFALPPFEAFRMTAISPALSRMEILFAVSLIILMFFKIGLLHYVTTSALAQTTGMREFKHLALAVGTIGVVYALSVYSSTLEHMQSASKQVPFLWLLFELILPLITLICAKVRGLSQPQGKAALE
ncbi:endospore germination permease [Oscillospiraceae bacterium MB08-C2-2]|nr:endospore germination permease [Oscillospiraceae bacterium MB08-C2-2]